uniref:Uncharacterized protein n=1 Tax=Arabidopsis thaliana TaxID=3702 RepID=Q56XJ9_ARATH|nr:hypothetical protein [Arabidopsis thaliana]
MVFFSPPFLINSPSGVVDGSIANTP